jgi:sugar lactone lactonase YvrE
MRIASGLLFALLALAACGTDAPRLELVAESDRQWTGVAVSLDERLFVNYPRWSDDVPVSVAELRDGKPIPYPNETWNSWEAGEDPTTHFVCVQSVTVDAQGYLWILDPANPEFQGVVPGGPKLLKVDLTTNEILKTYTFDAEVAPPNSYLNDLRIDTGRSIVYISDSGAGALVVLDAKSGTSRRLLANHPSTKAEPIDIVIEGKAWKRDGQTPQVHADGIALSRDSLWVYYQALTGRTMYRIPTAMLRDASLTPDALATGIEKVAESGVADGIAFGVDGSLYLSSLEENAVNRLRMPGHERELVVRDARLAWPDSFAVATSGSIYFTTAQIHRGPNPPEPYRLWRINP